jgi:hypothetical protein
VCLALGALFASTVGVLEHRFPRLFSFARQQNVSVNKSTVGVLEHRFPRLFSFARQQNVSVNKFLKQDAYTNFMTPISPLASDQLQELVLCVQGLAVDPYLEDQ